MKSHQFLLPSSIHKPNLKSLHIIKTKNLQSSGLLGLGLGLEAKFSGLGLEAFGLGLVQKPRPRSK